MIGIKEFGGKTSGSPPCRPKGGPKKTPAKERLGGHLRKTCASVRRTGAREIADMEESHIK